MRKLTRFLSAIVIVCCLCSLVSPVYAANFTDVSGLSTEFRDAINYLYDNGIMNGTSTTQFSPDEQLTRAMVITLLYRLSGDTGTYTCSFPDVPSDKYYYNAVGWGVSKGIITGHKDGTFHPYDWIKFEDFCTVLYRYAQVYNASTTGNVDETVIASAPDFSTVYEYAKDAICWFFSWGLKDRSSSTEALQPKAYVTRKYAALALHRYRVNVEGIVFGRDNFSFLNSGEYFVTKEGNKPFVSSSDWNSLCTYVAQRGSGALQMLKDEYKVMQWGGSCYGISLAVILDYLGKINFNGNYCNNVDTMFGIPALTQLSGGTHKITCDGNYPAVSISKAESKINMYQLLTYALYPGEWSKANDVSPNTTLHSLVQKLEHGGIGIFTYGYIDFNDTIYHAVVVYGKPQTCSGIYNGYRFSVYDSRYDHPVYLEIDTKGSKWLGRIYTDGVSEAISVCKFETDFSIFDIWDVDTPNNVVPSSLEANVLQEHYVLRISASGSFTVSNNNGKSFHFEDGIATGNMKVYGMNLSVDGSNAHGTISFLVDPCEEYICVADEGSEIHSMHLLTYDNYFEGVDTNSPDGWYITAITGIATSALDNK